MAMSEEQKAELEKVDKKIRFFTNLRLVILLLALLDVLVIFYGDKLAEGAAWLLYFKAYSYNILGIALAFILVTIIIRMILVAKHNSIVKKGMSQ
jgi:uncharacterized ion transporter superfamily protein YfcC